MSLGPTPSPARSFASRIASLPSLETSIFTAVWAGSVLKNSSAASSDPTTTSVIRS